MWFFLIKKFFSWNNFKTDEEIQFSSELLAKAESGNMNS